MRRLILALLAALLAVGLTPPADAAAPLGAPPQAAVAAVSHNLIIKASTKGTRLFGICQHWQSDAASTYACVADENGNPGLWGSLHPGQNSRDKYGWADTDAVQVTHGYTLMESVSGPDGVLAGCRARTFYKKLSPSIYGGANQTRAVYLKKCSAYDGAKTASSFSLGHVAPAAPAGKVAAKKAPAPTALVSYVKNVAGHSVKVRDSKNKRWHTLWEQGSGRRYVSTDWQIDKVKFSAHARCIWIRGGGQNDWYHVTADAKFKVARLGAKRVHVYQFDKPECDGASWWIGAIG